MIDFCNNREILKLIFSFKLREWRKEVNMSQKELGTALRVSEKTIKSWENRKTLPKWKVYIDLCKLMGVPLGGVFDMYPENKEN